MEDFGVLTEYHGAGWLTRSTRGYDDDDDDDDDVTLVDRDP